MYFSPMKLGQNIFSLMLMLCLSALSAASIPRWDTSVTEIDLNVFSGLDDEALNSNVWDMSGRTLLQANMGKQTFAEDGRYVETLGYRSDCFFISGDSMFWTGYNVGRRLGMLIDNPVLLCFNALSDPEKAVDYNAKGQLDVSSSLRARGVTISKNLGQGLSIPSPGDTIRNVVLTLQTDFLITTSETTLESDTLYRKVYRWYCADSKIPFAIQEEDRLYLPSSELLEQIKPSISATDVNNNDVTIIDNAVIHIEGSSVYVNLTDEIALNIYVMDVSGNIYRATEGTERSYSIDVSGLPHGSYVVSLVTPVGYNRKIYIGL